MPAHPLHALVSTLRRRPGVEAAVVVSPDGLAIVQDTAPGVDPEHLAAQAPLVLHALGDQAERAGRGPLRIAVLDHEGGGLVMAPLSPEATLLVVTAAVCDRATLLTDLRQYRQHLALLA